MNKKPPKFHKVYVNKALGYLEDKNKPFEFVPNDIKILECGVEDYIGYLQVAKKRMEVCRN